MRWCRVGNRVPVASRDLSDRRRGMTLFEVLLVLVLLMVAGSISMPLFEGSFGTVRLRRGVDQVVAAWTDARIQAVETGQTYMFLFQPETDLYRVEPWQPNVEPGTTPLNAVPAGRDPSLPAWLTYEARLPEGVVFVAAEALTMVEGDEQVVQTLNGGGQFAWAAPILFFPDGTTSAASVLVRNQKPLYQRITLRSLTGVARASDVLTRDEADSLKGR